jgi:hypothetical protein
MSDLIRVVIDGDDSVSAAVCQSPEIVAEAERHRSYAEHLERARFEHELVRSKLEAVKAQHSVARAQMQAAEAEWKAVRRADDISMMNDAQARRVRAESKLKWLNSDTAHLEVECAEALAWTHAPMSAFEYESPQEVAAPNIKQQEPPAPARLTPSEQETAAALGISAEEYRRRRHIMAGDARWRLDNRD